jgi:flagellin-like protein
MKMLKNKKALSPVVASIILIAVTVAVSIAVAAWMGALTFGFTDTEQLKIKAIDFGAAGDEADIEIDVQNLGTGPVTVVEIYVNGAEYLEATAPAAGWAGSGTIAANGEETFTVTLSAPWTNGHNYEVKVRTAKSNQFLYTATAPSS